MNKELREECVMEKCEEETELQRMVFRAEDLMGYSNSVRNLVETRLDRVIGSMPCDPNSEEVGPCTDVERVVYAMQQISSSLSAIEDNIRRL